MVTAAMSPPSDTDIKGENKLTLTPPASEEADQHDDSGSDLSDLEMEPDDSGEILPDHYYDGGKIPVFKPTMSQFHSFNSFIQKIDKYGMKSGIVKVIPPQEWRDSLPPLDEQVKTVKVKNPITQEFHGTHGTYTQANIEKQRSYNLPQWKALSEESNHQPPAKRGERRRNQEKTTRAGSSRAKKSAASASSDRRRGPGRPRVRPLPTSVHQHNEGPVVETADSEVQVPPTPTSPLLETTNLKKEQVNEDEDILLAKTKGRQPKSVSSRRQHNRRDQADVVDEESFKDFDYRVHNQADWTKERCSELETAYWKSLTFNNPMYGADMPGSLFDDSTKSWNVAKLENLLDVLGQKVPGVNTAYLYLGMWKASFAWHLEDVDLYSINYIHFGAPKQWYSISQEDARRFEAAMRNVWPNDAKNCGQFLRHKTYLISPQLLQSQYNIRVNRLVHHEGEFVITFPYGYHSGYNLGYNCAESVNFATESWLDFGRVAQKCNCEADSVWVDVGDIERKLRGEQTPEYYEETEDEDEDEDDEDDADGLPTPPGSVKGKPKHRNPKRKRGNNDKDTKSMVKKLRIKIKAPTHEPCVLCPSDNKYEELLPTDNGFEAHRRCALYTPETYIAEEDKVERVCNVARIDKARLELKCSFCRNKRGAVFQCSQKRCTRAYHATCAAPGGVQVDIGLVPVYGEDGTEYTDIGIDFRCRFHRAKRGKNVDSSALEENTFVRKHASKLSLGELVQVQYYQSEIFAGIVLENRKSEQTLLIEVLPDGENLEVEYKWLLVFDPANSQLPVPSDDAKPLPAHLARKSRITAEASPKIDEPFGDPQSKFIWSEFNTCKTVKNPDQVKIDLLKPKQIWFYLGRTSTEARAQYTADLRVQINNPEGNFLESIRAASAPIAIQKQGRSYPVPYPRSFNTYNANASCAKAYIQPAKAPAKKPFRAPIAKEKPYHGKYAIKDPVPYIYKPKISCNVDSEALQSQRSFQQSALHSPQQSFSSPKYRAPSTQMSPVAPQAPMMSTTMQYSPTPPFNSPEDVKQSSSVSLPPKKQAPCQRPQAPVANMTGENPRGNNISISRTPSISQSPIVFDSPTPSVPPTNVDTCHPVVAKYPYLLEAHKLRPNVYQSPYAAEGGFTTPYLPNTDVPKPKTSRNRSLSEDFLMKHSLSEQELLKSHKKQNSDSSSCFQQDQPQKQPSPEQHHKHHLKHPLSPNLSAHQPNSSNAYYPPHQYHHDYPSPYHNTFQQPQDIKHNPSSPSHDESSGLQFQSPQEFQMQMQREVQQQEWTKAQDGFDNFFRELQNVTTGHASGGGGGHNKTSPLKFEMGGGGEMLPMMRDRF